MVESYEYEDYFYTGSHQKHLLFVEQAADVTIVPGKPPKVTLPESENEPIVIANPNFISERFELEEIINSADNWAFGSVEPAMVTFDIRQDGSIPFLEDKKFRLYLYFDENSSTLLYIDTYEFDQDKLSDDSKQRQISGFNMIQNIRDTDVIDWYRNLFNAHEEPDPEDPEETIWVPAREKVSVLEARNSLFEELRTKHNIPVIQETVSLPNDAFEFAFDVDTEALSAAQILEDLCEVNGRYGNLGRRLSTSSATKNCAIFRYVEIPRYDEAGTKIANSIRYNGMNKGLYETKSITRLKVNNRDNKLIAQYDEGYKKGYSVYHIYDNILIDNRTKNKTLDADLSQMLQNIYNSMRYRKYVPFEAKAPADLCREVGDRITLWSDADIQIDGKKNSFRTLIFKRKISGIQKMVDTYSAKGDKKLPTFGTTTYSKSGGYSSKSGGTGSGSDEGSSEEGTTIQNADGTVIYEGLTREDFVELMRNYGFRVLEPLDTSCKYNAATGKVTIKWTDPDDISTTEPAKAKWVGTVVVRNSKIPPRNKWDGDLVVDSTVKNAYSQTGYEDTGVSRNKTYYYGIFPYDTDGDYGCVKIVKVDTNENILAPIIESVKMGAAGVWDGSEIDIMWVGNSNKLTVQISNSHIVFKLYTGSTQIYSFQSPVGSTTADVDKIHVGFLKDTTRHAAKPSFVYHTGTGDVFSYNQEAPSTSEMSLIYIWLQG